MNLQAFILEFLRRQSSVTVGEIVTACESAGYRICGDCELDVGRGRFIWAGVNAEFGEALQALVALRQCRLRQTSLVDCLASNPRHFFSRRFLPVRVENPQAAK